MVFNQSNFFSNFAQKRVSRPISLTHDWRYSKCKVLMFVQKTVDLSYFLIVSMADCAYERGRYVFLGNYFKASCLFGHIEKALGWESTIVVGPRKEKETHTRYPGPRLHPFIMDVRGRWGRSAHAFCAALWCSTWTPQREWRPSSLGSTRPGWPRPPGQRPTGPRSCPGGSPPTRSRRCHGRDRCPSRRESTTLRSSCTGLQSWKRNDLINLNRYIIGTYVMCVLDFCILAIHRRTLFNSSMGILKTLMCQIVDRHDRQTFSKVIENSQWCVLLQMLR